MPNIILEDLSLSFESPTGDKVSIYEDFNLFIEDGSFTVLLGPSGCGKSTFLNIISGLLTPDHAETINIGDQDIRNNPELTRKSAYIFQDPRLLPWKTLKGNVEFGLKGLGVKAKEDWEGLMAKYFKLAGLEGHVDHYPHQVSGGMQQRAAIVRAWVNEPEILLMDEPFSHLDEITGNKLRNELITLWASEENRRTVVFVTHSLSEAAQLATDVVMLSRAPTSIVHTQKVKLPWPRTPETPGVFEIENELRTIFEREVGVGS